MLCRYWRLICLYTACLVDQAQLCKLLPTVQLCWALLSQVPQLPVASLLGNLTRLCWAEERHREGVRRPPRVNIGWTLNTIILSRYIFGSCCLMNREMEIPRPSQLKVSQLKLLRDQLYHKQNGAMCVFFINFFWDQNGWCWLLMLHRMNMCACSFISPPLRIFHIHTSSSKINLSPFEYSWSGKHFELFSDCEICVWEQ